MVYVAVGGTFDPIHDGHEALLIKACELSRDGKLLIGLTSDEMVKDKAHAVRDFKTRYREIRRLMRTQRVNYTIVRLDDPYGPTVTDDFDYIVVSPETHPVALKINKIREERGKSQINIVLVDYVLAEDGLPISSTRIAGGEIDKHGKVLRTKS